MCSSIRWRCWLKALICWAEWQIQAQPPDTLGYVLCDPGWHLGVVGVIASRIVQKYYRPCLVLGVQGDMAQGSGRSIPDIDLIQVLRQCLPWLERCGGHPMAVGLALPLSRLDQLRTVFIEAIAKVMQNKRPQKPLDIAQWLTPEQVQPALLDTLMLFHPLGMGNPDPIFGLRGMVLTTPPQVFGRRNAHYRFSLQLRPDYCLPGIAWSQAKRLLPVKTPVDLAGKLGWNYWRDRKTAQLNLVDWRRSPA